ncbi:MAG: GIY-YIG nuclease family protein [Terriglobia bacterium]
MPYYVYILSSRSRNLYTGVTNNLARRVAEHREERTPGFTSRYHIHRLAYFERYRILHAAIAREKQIKAWRREKKIALIESQNPAWDDLTPGWLSSGKKEKPEKRRADSSLRSE